MSAEIGKTLTVMIDGRIVAVDHSLQERYTFKGAFFDTFEEALTARENEVNVVALRKLLAEFLIQACRNVNPALHDSVARQIAHQLGHVFWYQREREALFKALIAYDAATLPCLKALPEAVQFAQDTIKERWPPKGEGL